MYILDATIQNLRSIRRLHWQIPRARAAGWHVVLGPNGSGKSSFLQGLALGIVGQDGKQMAALPSDPWEWIRFGEQQLSTQLQLHFDDQWDAVSGSHKELTVGFEVSRNKTRRFPDSSSVWHAPSGPAEEPFSDAKGCFSASFGPIRRFTGSRREQEKGAARHSLLAPHLPIFDNSYVSGESVEWLQYLRLRQLEDPGNGSLLSDLVRFVNQPDLLPFATRLEEVNSDGVLFIDGQQNRVEMDDLSDGYRSILSLTLELVRLLARIFDEKKIFSKGDPIQAFPPGVVLIDEIDAHLHPSWQREIGFSLRRLFPNLQFIVTTHSPLICHAAVDGSVFVLPEPGNEESGEMLDGVALDRLLYGDILEAYASGAFGLSGARPENAQQQLDRLAKLNLQELDQGLAPAERDERDALRAKFPNAAHPLAHASNT